MNTQTSIDFSKTVTERAMKRAELHANQVHENWSDQVYALLTWFVERTPTPFMAEDFRADIKGLVPEPPTTRAFGAIMVRAAQAGLIRKVGYGQVKNLKAHRANASMWQRTQHFNSKL